MSFEVVVVEPDALSSQLVDARGGRCAPVDAKVAPTNVVDQNKDDIGLCCLFGNVLHRIHHPISPIRLVCAFNKVRKVLRVRPL